MNYNFTGKIKISSKSPKILGHGDQGTVFKIGESAFKTYNANAQRKSDDSEVAVRLSKLNLKYFVTPYSLQFDSKKNLIGFKMRLLKKGTKEKLTNMDICDAVKNIKGIRKETKIISDNGIIFNDLQPHNVIITENGIEVYDFSAYGISNLPSVASINDSEIDNLFGSLLLTTEMPDIDPIMLYDAIYSDYKKGECSTIEEYYDKTISNGSIREYVLQKRKNNLNFMR